MKKIYYFILLINLNKYHIYLLFNKIRHTLPIIIILTLSLTGYMLYSLGKE